MSLSGRVAAALGLLAVWVAGPAAAQDSVFGIRGLGFVGVPGTARSEAMGGAYAPFDGGGVLNPASLAAWSGSAGWAVGAAERRSFDPGTGALTLTSMRFPLFGFATPMSRRLVIGVSVSDYLNRNWSVARTDTVTPRDSALAVSDQTKSSGGVSDIRAAAAWRAGERVTLGLGLHFLTGSAQNTVARAFPADSSYIPFAQTGATDYTAVAASLGALLTPLPRLIVSVGARVSSRLKAASPDTTVRLQLPVELHAGVYFAPTDRLTIAALVTRAGWGSASQDLVAAGLPASRDTWSAGVGVQAAVARFFGEDVPLRLGYRWRELPFAVGTAALSERAGTFGFGLTGAGGRAGLDLAVEIGSRTAGALTERFTTMLLGVSILP